MTQILILDSSIIIGVGPFIETEDEIICTDIIYPKHILDSWNIVEVELPEGFIASEYTYSPSSVEVVKKPPIFIPPTLQEYTNYVQDYLDSKAQERNYDGILSACSYAASIDAKFSAEGNACLAWRDNVWKICYQILDDVNSGHRTAPTFEQLKSELPILTWPTI